MIGKLFLLTSLSILLVNAGGLAAEHDASQVTPQAIPWFSTRTLKPGDNFCEVIPNAYGRVQTTISFCNQGKECPYQQYDFAEPNMQWLRHYKVTCGDPLPQVTNARDDESFTFSGHHFLVETVPVAEGSTIPGLYRVYPENISDNGNTDLIIKAAKAWMRHKRGARAFPYKGQPVTEEDTDPHTFADRIAESNLFGGHKKVKKEKKKVQAADSIEKFVKPPYYPAATATDSRPASAGISHIEIGQEP